MGKPKDTRKTPAEYIGIGSNPGDEGNKKTVITHATTVSEKALLVILALLF